MDVGFHYLLEFFECSLDLLDDEKYLKKALLTAVRETGATEIGHLFHKYTPQGVSGVVLIAESHFSLHTWPEHAYAAIDFFTCGNAVEIEAAYLKLAEALHSERYFLRKITRGPDYLENSKNISNTIM